MPLREELSVKSADVLSSEFKEALSRLNLAVDWIGFAWRFQGYSTGQNQDLLKEFYSDLKKTMIRYTFNHLEHLQAKERDCN